MDEAFIFRFGKGVENKQGNYCSEKVKVEKIVLLNRMTEFLKEWLSLSLELQFDGIGGYMSPTFLSQRMLSHSLPCLFAGLEEGEK